MEWLNYHHLYYFWVITQEGSLTKAAARLRVSHSTFSVQIRMLEDFLGSQLFERKGKRLILTPFGSEMAAYASDIFHMGSELVDVARGRLASKNSFFRVGVVGTIPRTVVYRLLEPALAPFGNTLLQIHQDSSENLLQMLAANRIHLILSDLPPSGGTTYRVHTHALGETDILLYPQWTHQIRPVVDGSKPASWGWDRLMAKSYPRSTFSSNPCVWFSSFAGRI